MSRPIVNLSASKRLMREIGAVDKACWLNAFHALAQLHREGVHDATYVEGFAVGTFPMVCEHGWVERRGRVIETTPVWLGHARDNRYFPGLRYTLEEIVALLALHDHSLPMAWETGGFGGFKHAEYRAARENAERAIHGGRTIAELLANLPQAVAQ